MLINFESTELPSMQQQSIAVNTFNQDSLPPQEQKSKKSYNIIFILLIFLTTISAIVLSIFIFSGKNKNKIVSNKQTKPIQTTEAVITPDKKFVMYYVKENDLFGANADGTRIEKLEENVKELDSVSPDGEMYLFRQYTESDITKRKLENNPEDQIILKNISGKTLVLEGLGVIGYWSANSQLVLIETRNRDLKQFDLNYRIVNTTTFQTSPVNFPEESYYPLALLNNGHLLLRKNLSDTERTDKQNVELFEYDPSNNTIKSIGKIKMSLGKLSFDNTMYSYSNTLNIEILNLNTKEKKVYTNYTDSHLDLIRNTSWSPSNNHIAFNVSSLEYKINILSLNNGQIVSVSDKDFTQQYPEKDNKEFRISALNPEGWLTADKLFIKSEAVYGVGNFKEKRSDKYWIYDIDTKQLTLLSWLDSSDVEFINNPH